VLTIEELADLLEVSAWDVMRWEDGRDGRGPAGATLVILRALEHEAKRDPTFPLRLRQWAQLGQHYVLRQLRDAAP
jgi:hypothetical protein